MTKFDDLPQPHPPNVVLYHAECMDGFGSAWALWKRFPDARYVAVKHGFPPPDGLQNQHVVMVDFSYPRAAILQLAEHTASLHILDHHITAQASLADLPFAYFDMNRSGAVLAWEWAHGQTVPWLLQYVQDKDLWQWHLPFSREISAALASYPFDLYAGAGRGRSPSIRRRIPQTRSLGSATSAIWKVTYRPWLTTFAPISTSASHSAAIGPYSKSFGPTDPFLGHQRHSSSPPPP